MSPRAVKRRLAQHAEKTKESPMAATSSTSTKTTRKNVVVAAAAEVSISPTFCEQLFHTKVFRAAFLYLQLQFVFFCCTEIDAKAARKMLVKLTTGHRNERHLEPELEEI